MAIFNLMARMITVELGAMLRVLNRIISFQAFGAVEAMSDRWCIHSGGKEHFRFSAEDLVSCCHMCGFGCNGGFPGAAWAYWVHSGIVSGGSYGSNQVSEKNLRQVRL
jgi:hypothetical protein